MRVAVVWNNDRTGEINPYGQSRPEDYDRKTGEKAVREGDRKAYEGDNGLLHRDSQAAPHSVRQQ